MAMQPGNGQERQVTLKNLLFFAPKVWKGGRPLWKGLLKR